MTENVEKVKNILNITDDKLDNYLEFCEKNITDKILDRCNIEDIPERLNSLIQEFLIEQYNINNLHNQLINWHKFLTCYKP